MNFKEDLPDKCLLCFKTDREDIISNCQFCQDLTFPELHLCDLNMAVQAFPNEFVCHAFQPMLKIVGSGTKTVPDRADNKKEELFLSDKTNYHIALHLQKLGRDPDFIFSVLKYHITWNVFQREKAFPESPELMESILEIFKSSIHRANTIVLPLWIAADHVHVYVETSSKISVEAITRKIKKATERKLMRILNDMNGRKSKTSLWDDAYFAETVS